MYDDYIKDEIRHRLRNVKFVSTEMQKIKDEYGMSIMTQRRILKKSNKIE